jgi:hypothetical protein
MLISAKQAGRCLGLAVNSTYSAIKNGDIPSIKMGKRQMVSKFALAKIAGVEIDEIDQRLAEISSRSKAK